MNYKQFTKKARPDLIFFIVGFLVFPVVIIISIYSIFKVKEDINPTSYPIDDLSISINEVPKTNHAGSTNTGAMTSSTSTIRTGHSEDGLKKSVANQSYIIESGNWNATQYSQGDIIKNTYVVQLGDTLWQIANAYYGNPDDWTKILEANKDSIGVLPDGEQALINPGQIITIP